MNYLATFSLLFLFLVPNVASSATHNFSFKITSVDVSPGWIESDPGSDANVAYYLAGLENHRNSGTLFSGSVWLSSSGELRCSLNAPFYCPDPAGPGWRSLDGTQFKSNNYSDGLSINLKVGGLLQHQEDWYSSTLGDVVFTVKGVVDSVTSTFANPSAAPTAPVPVPFSAALLPIGFLGLGWFRHRQRRRPAAAA
jgi:hypothetical protein